MSVARWRAEIKEINETIRCYKARRASLAAAIKRSGKGMAGGSRSKRGAGGGAARDQLKNP